VRFPGAYAISILTPKLIAAVEKSRTSIIRADDIDRACRRWQRAVRIFSKAERLKARPAGMGKRPDYPAALLRSTEINGVEAARRHNPFRLDAE
jgi:hypothetical protein